MADVDIDKLMRMAAFDRVRMLSEPIHAGRAAGHLKTHETSREVSREFMG